VVALPDSFSSPVLLFAAIPCCFSCTCFYEVTCCSRFNNIFERYVRLARQLSGEIIVSQYFTRHLVLSTFHITARQLIQLVHLTYRPNGSGQSWRKIYHLKSPLEYLVDFRLLPGKLGNKILVVKNPKQPRAQCP
jgi:hypothetical protein